TATPPSHSDSVTARDYIWNADGEVGGINDKLRGCLVFSYDRSGWLTAEHSVHGSIKYRRDALGNPTDITLPDGQHLSHLYYGSGHLLQTALDGITVSEYERDSLHRQVMRTQGKLATFS
ncbi:RHS repeat protein, partial [Escherichia coli]|nr:RHS repeat protein [Escherichia coli]